jgi:predicted DCC family thiol-disulfide oxidoreductase YuxK
LKIVFYDGSCGLCQKSVKLLHLLDKKKILYYAPINGVMFKKINSYEISNLTSVIYYNGNKSFYKSTAILEFFWDLGGIFKIFYVLKLTPKFLRDYLYDLVVKNRKYFACEMIDKSEKFLD